MTKKFKQKAQHSLVKFKDPVAQATSWGPVVRGGVRMRNRRLRKASKTRFEFEMTQRGLIAPAFFMLLGLIAAVSILRNFAASETRDIVIMAFFAAGAIGVGVMILRRELVPQVFDKEVGFYYVGEKTPYYFKGEFVGNGCSLKEVHAIQLIQESVARPKRERRSPFFYVYELNLVLADGRRINVLDHSNRKAIQSEGKELARFLNVPCWDNTHSDSPKAFALLDRFRN